jgi:hypothetical protein
MRTRVSRHRKTEEAGPHPLSEPDVGADHLRERRVRPVARRSSVAAVGLLLLLVAASCGGSDNARGRAAETAVEPTTSTPAETMPLVGEWERVTTCAELARAYRQAGFDREARWAGAGNDFIPGVTSVDQLTDPEDHPCEGAVPRKHSHFFTADGRFGSRDWRGTQVDDGTYEIIDDSTFAMPYFERKPIVVEFRYRIDGDTLRLDPELPSDCSTRRCREVAAWAVSVAYAGEQWERVD